MLLIWQVNTTGDPRGKPFKYLLVDALPSSGLNLFNISEDDGKIRLIIVKQIVHLLHQYLNDVSW